MPTETHDVTLRRAEGSRYARLAGHVPDEFLVAGPSGSVVDVESLEIVTPESFQTINVTLIHGDLPRAFATAWPTREARAHLSMLVPPGCGWQVVVSFWDDDMRYQVTPAWCRLRVSKRAA